jgi:hypothetical protein
MNVYETADDWSPTDNLHAIAMSEANAWRRAVDLCALRTKSGSPDQQTDARMFLLALRQFLKAAQMAADAVQGSTEEQALADARDQFARVVPGAKAACDMVEHFREYARGTGDLQQGGPRHLRQDDPVAAARDWPLGYDPGTDQITLGRHKVCLTTACEQVKLLQLAIWQAVRRG